MHRRSPWTVPPLLGLSVALGACTNPAATFDAEQAQRRAGWAAQRTVAQESARQRREAIRQVALPPDYREQIDANFVRTLKDPDSRKVVYHGNPYGSLVCGTVNARNAYGGYTGQQIFAAFFQPAGTPADVVVFDPPPPPRHPAAALSEQARSCGGLPRAEPVSGLWRDVRRGGLTSARRVPTARHKKERKSLCP